MKLDGFEIMADDMAVMIRFYRAVGTENLLCG